MLEPKRRFFKLALVERLVPGVALPIAVARGNTDTINRLTKHPHTLSNHTTTMVSVLKTEH